MCAYFLKRDLDLPAAHEPCEDILRAGVKIRGQECLRIGLALGITNEEPADRHRSNTGTIPERSPTGDLDHTIDAPVPQTDAAALPADLVILENGGELPQSLPLDRRSAAAFVLWLREGEQVSVEPQPSDDADVFAHRGEEFDGGKGAVGDQNDGVTGQPAVDLQCGLPRPINKCLRCPQLRTLSKITESVAMSAATE